ncbi:hypothetical protein GCM10010193_57070 [Kitasatospora atroaurantiaca]|uniref:Uncharacterized protein n=1 Tax=Kitasatospora atroaurantiaca TaxID=285545 RepID=A0A561EMV7_9ACTN|nr:hypothetical protein [Kitasatospora atroaurantiaca]TWE16956.1 hypothetical protein FB465_1951 [Kitasatospora atroaurantiaca]
MERGKPYIVGMQEFAAIYDVQSQMIRQWLHRGALDAETAIVVSGQLYWPLGFAAGYGETTPRRKTLNEAALQELVEQQEPGWMPQTKAELPAIVGQQEIVAMFDLPSQPTLVMAVETGRFVAADWRLGGSGGLWLLDTVLETVPDLQASARTLSWVPNPDVVAALRAGRYEGPGSVVLSRGRAAKK